MPTEHYINIDNRPIPIIAFFGTKGGVGKTTVMDKFATLVSSSAACPNVLLVDFDVHHRGLTVLRTKDHTGSGVTTIHEYLSNEHLSFSAACDVTPADDLSTRGRQFLIPSSNLAAERVFATLAGAEPMQLLDRLRGILTAASQQYRIDLVLIDCGPVVDPLTASAAVMADTAFIIGQNEPISFQALQNYAIRIRDFFPDFTASKVKVLLNKVRGPILQGASIYAAIPFTMEVVDYSEGLANIDEIRLIYFDHCVRELVHSVFHEKRPELVPGPEGILTQNQRIAVDMIDQYPSSVWYSRLKKGSLVLLAGATVVAFGVLFFALTTMASAGEKEFLFKNRGHISGGLIVVALLLACVGISFFRQLRLAKSLVRIKRFGGYQGLLELLATRAGRKKFSAIGTFSEKTGKEPPR